MPIANDSLNLASVIDVDCITFYVIYVLGFHKHSISQSTPEFLYVKAFTALIPFRP